MYDYIILTTAVTRPSLHRKVFPDHLELLGGARVKWLINVDDVNTSASVAETKAGLEQLLAVENVDLEILTGASPCFFQAAVRLVRRAHELLGECRIGVLWLEDDWIHRRCNMAQTGLNRLRLEMATDLTGRPITRCPGSLAAKAAKLEALERTAPEAPWFVSLVPRSRVSFNPGIWSRSLFEQALWEPLSRAPAKGDPESLCADPLNDPRTYAQLTILVDPLFQDAGRQWSAELGVDKWSKLPSKLQHASTVTYRIRRLPSRTQDAEATALCGWIQIPQQVLGMTWRLVGKIELREGVLTVSLAGMPSLHIELRPVAQGEALLYLHRLQGWARTYPFKKLPGHVTWRTDGPVVMDVDDGGRLFSMEVTKAMPWRALWMVPLQLALALPVYLATLVPALRTLDAERPRTV